MLEDGLFTRFPRPNFALSLHDDDTIDSTIDRVAEALEVYRLALENGAEGYLAGPSVKPVYRRYN